MRALITITDPAAAALLASPTASNIVLTLIGKELSLSELARAIEAPLSLAHYHVAKCVGLGLVSVVRELPRAGRAVKRYRAAAKVFFLPSDLIVEMPDAEMTRRLRAALDRNVAKSLKGINFTHDGRNSRIELVRDPAARAKGIELWLDVGLGAADTAALIRDLEAVLARYREHDDDSAPRYLVHLAVART